MEGAARSVQDDLPGPFGEPDVRHTAERQLERVGAGGDDRDVRRPEEESCIAGRARLEKGAVERLGRPEAVREQAPDARGVAGLAERLRERLVPPGEHRDPERPRGMEAERQDATLVGEDVHVEELDSEAADRDAVVVDPGLALAARGASLETVGLERAEGAPGLLDAAHLAASVRRSGRRTRGRTSGFRRPRCRR